jgi:hypothetical protein
MGTIRQVKERYERAYLAIPGAVAATVARTSDVLLDLNKDQMLQGRDADGNVLTPGYLQDDYFETREQALRYLRMKIMLENVHLGRRRFTGVQLYPDKNSNTPNLIVTGPFHNGMFIRVTQDAYTIDSSYADADDINAKYNNRVYGLAPKSREFYYFGFIRRAILELYKK